MVPTGAFACNARYNVSVLKTGMAGLDSPLSPRQGNRIWKKRWRNSTPSGNKHNEHALSGHGFPFAKVGVAVGRHDKCGHPGHHAVLA